MADGQRAKFERDQQHVAAGPRLREPGRDRKSGHAARAAEPEHRHPRYVGSEAHLAGDTRVQRRCRDPGRTDGDDGIDIASIEIGAHDGLARDVDKEGFSTFQKSLGSLGPAAMLEIPFHRLDAVTLMNAGIGEQARKRLELRIAIRQEAGGGFEDLLLVELMGRDRGRQRNERGRVVHILSLPLMPLDL